MKFKLELLIDKPRMEVWKTFDDPGNMSGWQPSLKKVELVSGTPGQPGAVSKLTYEENEREFVLSEKVIQRNVPNRFDGVYDNEFAENIVRYTFVEQDESSTLWVVETEYRFKTWIMKIVGPLTKKNLVLRTQRDMERFKELAERL